MDKLQTLVNEKNITRDELIKKMKELLWEPYKKKKNDTYGKKKKNDTYGKKKKNDTYGKRLENCYEIIRRWNINNYKDTPIEGEDVIYKKKKLPTSVQEMIRDKKWKEIANYLKYEKKLIDEIVFKVKREYPLYDMVVNTIKDDEDKTTKLNYEMMTWREKFNETKKMFKKDMKSNYERLKKFKNEIVAKKRKKKKNYQLKF